MLTNYLKHISRLIFLIISVNFVLFLPAQTREKTAWQEIRKNFENPPTDCRPHTRWWWLGNAARKEDITFQLEQMQEKGLGGVEQISMGAVYEKGNVPYLSDEFIELLKHTVTTAKRLGLEVSLNFGGPGWIIGGGWVPPEDRSKDLVPTAIDLVGPQKYSGPLPNSLRKTKRSWEHYSPNLSGEEKLMAVIAGKVVDNRIEERSLINLTSQISRQNTLEWSVPEGHWRLMAFWLKFNRPGNAVDHFNKAAMQRYCDFLGNKFFKAFGKEFGKTVDSFFCDSFELANSASGIYWSTGLFEIFKQVEGYDLARYLPAIWWEVGDISPKIRYDVNHFLHYQGLDAFFKTFLDWCAAHGIQGRIQPYGFPTDIIEGAGLCHLPEMEITAGEKDAVPWFDTRIGPKKYVASGAHLYGRNIVTTEAYTFMHWELYRSTLEELKIAGDNYLRAGANKFYNHGYSFSPEKKAEPSRTIGFAALINHHNIWWNYYPLLADYIARCSWLLRQGHFAPDVAIYSPLANQWTLNVLNARKWTREFYWGDLGKFLISNGYDYDLVNDDVLQNHAAIENGIFKIREMEYKILILPNIKTLPLETLEFIQRYVQTGGTVIALERTPEAATGFREHQQKDKRVREISQAMFQQPPGTYAVGTRRFGTGATHQIKYVINRQEVLDWRSSTLDPFVNLLRKTIPPDFGIDFVTAGIRENNGLTFLHRKTDDLDIYFVTNIQDRACELPVTFRVKSKQPWQWNPYNGKAAPLFAYRMTADGTEIPLRLEPYESAFFIFKPAKNETHVKLTSLYKIQQLDSVNIYGLAAENGDQYLQVKYKNRIQEQTVIVRDLPAPFRIQGDWQLTLENSDFPQISKTLKNLTSWTADPRTKHFSGKGRYEIEFTLPAEYLNLDFVLQLDLGKVGNIAEVELNGKKVGVAWMRGQKLDVTIQLRAGQNRLVVWVTNTLINQVTGFKAPRPIPQDLVSHFGKAKTSYSSRYNRILKFKPLPFSGLLGPVQIIPFKKVKIPLCSEFKL